MVCTAVLSLQVDLDLLEALLEYVCGDGRHKSVEDVLEGAVLVFMPGWDEIIRMKEKLQASTVFQDNQR